MADPSVVHVLEDWKLWFKDEVFISWLVPRPRHTKDARCLHFTYNNGTNGGPQRGDHGRRWQGLLCFHPGGRSRLFRARDRVPSFSGWGFATPPQPTRDELGAELAGADTATIMTVLHPWRLPRNAPFWLVIHDQDGTNREIVQVTGVAANGSYTVRRGQLGTQSVLHRYVNEQHLSHVELICPAGAPTDQPLAIHDPRPTNWIWIEIPWDGSGATFTEHDSDDRDLPGIAHSTKTVVPTKGQIASEENPPGRKGRGELVFDGPWWLLYQKTTIDMSRLGGNGGEWFPTLESNWP